MWYPLLLLALVGVRQRWRSLTPELAFTLLVTSGLAVMWGLVEGNFGTAYRHRGELVWGVVIFAGIVAQLPTALASTLELGRQGRLSTAFILFLLVMSVAVIAFIVSVVFIALWIRSTGLDWKMVIPMTLGLFIAYIGLGRVIAETGVVYMSMPINEAGFADLFFHPFPPPILPRVSSTHVRPPVYKYINM